MAPLAKRQREPLISLGLYHLFKWTVVSPVLHTYFRGRIRGADRVPQSGPLLVVSNHASDFDPPILSACMRRPVAYMAKQSLFEVPVLKQAIAAYGAYPVKRGAADRSALRSAMAMLDQNWAVGVFITGTRTPDGRVHDPKVGAAWIAAMKQAPILPVCLWGTEQIFRPNSALPRPAPLTIRIGEVIAPPASTDRAQLEATTQHCAEAINQLYDLGR
jgi:1-acyl-sn-glycerol-3-phosphate acyltransferase